MSNILKNISNPEDVKKLNSAQLPALCEEIRKELIEIVSDTGGHLASNLGTVEVTVALHRAFDLPKDKIVFDVGHQCYTHKLLTGRRDNFCTLRQKDGISGFPRPEESEYDAFAAGHASTSVSAALGIAEANRLANEGGYVVALVGDGAMSGGLIFEGLNNAGRTKDDKLIVILNDNKMSIAGNVGAMSKYLANVRVKRGYHRFKIGAERVLSGIPFIGRRLRNFVANTKKVFKALIFKSTIFEDLGFFYMGPVDGHNINKLEFMLQLAKRQDKPVLLHIDTIKGKGYSPAESLPSSFHGVSSFNIETGELECGRASFSTEFGKILTEFAEKDKKICAITAAMGESTGLLEFERKFPRRFYDVGIAESHAVTFAGGLAIRGMIPVFAVYSTFLQRSYDQIIHDAALQNLKVVLAVDRAGLVGEDGHTHQGVFDVAFLNAIPNVTVYSPSSFSELRSSFERAVYKDEGVVAVRYSRGGECDVDVDFSGADFDVFGEEDAEVCIITYGREFFEVYNAYKRLVSAGERVKIIKLLKVKPVSAEAVKAALSAKSVYFFEEGMKSGGVGTHFANLMLEQGYSGRVSVTAIETFVAHASVSEQLRELKLDSDSIFEKVMGEN